MKAKRFKYTILKNTDGKYWLWFDEGGQMIDGKYAPNLKPYHEIETSAALREGSEVWSESLMSVPSTCQLRPLGEYSENYVVKAVLRNENEFIMSQTILDAPLRNAPVGKKPGMGQQ